MLGEYDGSGMLIEETVWLGDIPVATLRTNGGGGVDIFYVHTDQLNTPRAVTRPSDNALMWSWYSDPYGTDAANENPGGAGTFKYNLRFPGQIFDGQAGLHANGFRDCYDPAIGRYCEPDPIGLAGGSLSPYAYAAGDPIRLIDPDGRDIAVIENGPTVGNPIGHTAIAVTGAGVYSYGNGTPAGLSLQSYLLRESQRRDSDVYVIKTTPEQDAAALAYLRQFKDTTLPKDFLSTYFVDNCSVRSNNALDAARVFRPPSEDPFGAPPGENVPGSAAQRAAAAAAQMYSIPRGTQAVPPELRQFEPQ